MSLPDNSTVATNEAFKYHWKIWKFFGLQPPQRDSKWFKPYIAYGVLLNLTILCFPISLIIKLVLSKTITELCENLYNTITVAVANIKFFNTILVTHKLLKAKKILEPLDARAQTPKERAILEEGIVSARKIFIILARITCCGLITSQMIVYISSERVLMYPGWFPWDWKASTRNFLFAHSYQVYGLTMQATQNLVNETYPPAYFIILSAHIKALSARIRDLGSGGPKSEDILYKELTDCIKDHKTIHKLFLSVQEIISMTCLIQFGATCLAQCAMGVYLLYVGNDISKILNTLIYFTAITSEIFILCYYGDLYCQANDHLCESIYECNWIERSPKFKKTFRFLLQRSQMSTTIMAGNMIPVRIPTFVTVVKTAYSVFTVLNEVK